MNRQHFLQYAVQNRRASVRHQQADITLDAAIPPDLIVNLPDRPHSENRSGDNHHVKQDIHAAEVVGRSLVNQQEQNFHHQTDEKIIRHEFPSGVEKSALPRLPVLLYLIHNSILSEKKRRRSRRSFRNFPQMKSRNAFRRNTVRARSVEVCEADRGYIGNGSATVMGYISLSGLQPTARRMQVASDYILTQIVLFFNSKRLFFIFSTI